MINHLQKLLFACIIILWEKLDSTWVACLYFYPRRGKWIQISEYKFQVCFLWLDLPTLCVIQNATTTNINCIFPQHNIDAGNYSSRITDWSYVFLKLDGWEFHKHSLSETKRWNFTWIYVLNKKWYKFSCYNFGPETNSEGILLKITFYKFKMCSLNH